MERKSRLIASRPRLMPELVLATISEKPDMEAIGEIREDPEIAHVVGQSQPDHDHRTGQSGRAPNSLR